VDRRKKQPPVLPDVEAEYVDLKLRLADSLRRRREKQRISLSDLARLVGSSQSRVAKMERGDPSVSLDLLVRTLLAVGASRRDLARAVAPEAW
jgi:transcriptional regulator with XRE-family HTH domain